MPVRTGAITSSTDASTSIGDMAKKKLALRPFTSKPSTAPMLDSIHQSPPAASVSTALKDVKLPPLLARQAYASAVVKGSSAKGTSSSKKVPIMPRGQAATVYKAMALGLNPTAAADPVTSPQLKDQVRSAADSSPRHHRYSQQQHILMPSPTLPQGSFNASPAATAQTNITMPTNTSNQMATVLSQPESGTVFPNISSPQMQARRSTHLASEKKRRQNISNGFEEVRQAIESSYSSSTNTSSGILKKTKGADATKAAAKGSTNSGSKNDSKAQILRRAASRLAELSTELFLLRQLVFECDRCCAEYQTRRSKLILDLPSFISGGVSGAGHHSRVHCSSTSDAKRKVPIASISSATPLPSKRRAPTRKAEKATAAATNDDEDELMISAATLTSLKNTAI